MANYLSEMHYEVHVAVPDNPNYTNIDQSLEELIYPAVRVTKLKIREVRNILSKSKKFENKSKMDDIFFKDPKTTTWKEKMLLWIRGNIFIPDARVSWYYQIRNRIVQYVKDNNVQTIITSGTPHSLHLVGLYAKKRTKVSWIADFRDPWTTMEYHEKMPLTNRTRRMHKRMESDVLSLSDAAVSVSPQWASEFEELGCHNSQVVLNGFDEKTFQGIKFPMDSSFTICHTGTIRADRNPTILWEVVKKMRAAGHAISVHLYGNVAMQIQEDIQHRGIEEFVKIFPSVEHKKILEIMQRSSVLLVLVNQDRRNSLGRIPAKIFEYIRSMRPILLIGNPKGDAAKLVLEDSLGVVVDNSDREKLEKEIISLYSQWKSDKNIIPNVKYKKYSRKEMARKYSQIIDSILDKKDKKLGAPASEKL